MEMKGKWQEMKAMEEWTNCTDTEYKPGRFLDVEYIAFETGKNTVAVRMGGKWAKQGKVLPPTMCVKVTTDLGYFFSPRSRSIGGCDETNFAWGTLIEGWVQPLGEHGCDYAMEKLTNRTETEYKQGPTMCVKVPTDLEFDVFVRCQRDGYHWVKLGNGMEMKGK